MTRAEIAARLRAAGIEEADEEAKLLFCHFSGMSRASVLAEPGADCSAPLLLSAVERREAREPLAYILGEWYFYGECYRVSPACLIPRPDTEMLVDYATEHLRRDGRFSDLCTGSGCIAISTLAHRPDLVGEAYDLSPKALALARENAAKNGVADRLTCYERDLLRDPLAGEYDMILSNPPYVTPAEFTEVEPELLCEPRMAFLGGEDGLDFYRSFVHRFQGNLAAGGCFVFEIGWRQAEGLCRLAEEAGMTCEIRRDLGGRDRMAILHRK